MSETAEVTKSEFASLSDFLGFIVIPPTHEWGAPRGSVAAWIAAHLAASVAYLGVVIGSAPASEWWRVFLLCAWVVLGSGLPLLAARRIVMSEQTPLLRPVLLRRTRLYSPDAKLGLYLTATYVIYTVAQGLGRYAVVGQLTLLGLVLGLRIAGLDAWRARSRPALSYAKAVVSVDGIGRIISALLIAAGVLAFMAFAIDPFFLEGPDDTIGDFLGGVTRRQQFLELAVVFVVLPLPIAVVCEGISAASRYEQAMADELELETTRTERLRTRRDVGIALHDDVETKLGQAEELSGDPQLIRLLWEVRQGLRLRQIQLRDDVTTKTVGQTLARPIRDANRSLSVDLSLVHDESVLDTPISAADSALLHRVAYVQLNNSSRAGRPTAELAAQLVGSSVVVGYTDYGRFSIDDAFEIGGGLADLRTSLRRFGGEFSLHDDGERVRSVAVLPLGTSDG